MVTETTGTASDHFLVLTMVKFESLRSNKVCADKTTRNINDIDNELLKKDIKLFNEVKTVCESSTIDDAVQQYNNLMALTIDKHAPKIKPYIGLNKTPWWDVQCQEV